MKKVVVKQEAEKEIPTEILATSIVAISEGVRKLRSGRLNERALLLLIKDAIPRQHTLGLGDIRAVLDAAESLERTFLKSKKSV